VTKLSFALATLVLGIGVGVTTVQASPGHAPLNFSRAPAAVSTSNPLVKADYYGENDGTICRNGNLTCTGGHDTIGWFCQCPGFSGWWSAD
jgi:hypothetical protein